MSASRPWKVGQSWEGRSAEPSYDRAAPAVSHISSLEDNNTFLLFSSFVKIFLLACDKLLNTFLKHCEKLQQMRPAYVDPVRPPEPPLRQPCLCVLSLPGPLRQFHVHHPDLESPLHWVTSAPTTSFLVPTIQPLSLSPLSSSYYSAFR